MTGKNYEDFQNSTKCWVCKKMYKKEDAKEEDHCHITKTYKSFAHVECNINLSLTKKIPVVFQNFQNYDLDLIFQELGRYMLH